MSPPSSRACFLAVFLLLVCAASFFVLPYSAARLKPVRNPLPLSKVANEPTKLPWGAWKPHCVLLFPTSYGSTPPLSPAVPLAPSFATQPSLVDAVLTGRCVFVVAITSSWLVPILNSSLLLESVTFDGGGFKIGLPMVELGKPTSIQRTFVRNRVYCDDRFARVRSLTLTLHQSWNGTLWAVRTTVFRETGDSTNRWPLAWDGDAQVKPSPSPTSSNSSITSTPAPISVGACTLFNNGPKFLLWVRYMHAIGIDTVYGYYNGNLTDLDYLRADAADLVASGALRLGEWLGPYTSWFGYKTLKWDGWQETQHGSMTSCLDRHFSKHAWMALMDDDEYLDVRAPPPATLKSLLATMPGYTVRIFSRWAFLNASLVGQQLIVTP